MVICLHLGPKQDRNKTYVTFQISKSQKNKNQKTHFTKKQNLAKVLGSEKWEGEISRVFFIDRLFGGVSPAKWQVYRGHI